MITAADLLVTPGPKALVKVCRWCLPIEQIAYLKNVYPLTYGMCPACSHLFLSSPRVTRQESV